MNKLLVVVAMVMAMVMVGGSAAAAPAVPAPWNRINFRSTDDAIERLMQVTPLEEPCQDSGRYKTGAFCWSLNDRYGDQTVSVYFASVAAARKQLTGAWGKPTYKVKRDADDWTETWHLSAGRKQVIATLQPVGTGARVDLNERIPLPTLLTGSAPDGIGKLVGQPKTALDAFGARLDCSSGDCAIHLPPSEHGPGVVTIELDATTDLITRVTYIVECETACAKSGVIKAFGRTLGRVGITTFSFNGSDWTRVTFGKAAAPTLDIRDSRPTVGALCLGACED